MENPLSTCAQRCKSTLIRFDGLHAEKGFILILLIGRYKINNSSRYGNKETGFLFSITVSFYLFNSKINLSEAEKSNERPRDSRCALYFFSSNFLASVLFQLFRKAIINSGCLLISSQSILRAVSLSPIARYMEKQALNLSLGISFFLILLTFEHNIKKQISTINSIAACSQKAKDNSSILLCILIYNAQISIQFSRKANEAPSVVDGTDTKPPYSGPMPFCEVASKTAWEGTKKPRQRTDGASVRQ